MDKVRKPNISECINGFRMVLRVKIDFFLSNINRFVLDMKEQFVSCELTTNSFTYYLDGFEASDGIS
jgi:hypothetical protein